MAPAALQAEAALQRVRQAIQLNPSCAKYRQSLGRLLAAMGLWEEAAGAYERACEKSPRTVQLHLDLARAYKHLDRHGLAADAYLRVLQLQPNHPSAHCKRAGALRQSRRLEAAAEEYRQQLQLQPQHAQAAFWLAALTGDASTAACPSDMVAGLFDQVRMQCQRLRTCGHRMYGWVVKGHHMLPCRGWLCDYMACQPVSLTLLPPRPHVSPLPTLMKSFPLLAAASAVCRPF